MKLTNTILLLFLTLSIKADVLLSSGHLSAWQTVFFEVVSTKSYRLSTPGNNGVNGYISGAYLNPEQYFIWCGSENWACDWADKIFTPVSDRSFRIMSAGETVQSVYYEFYESTSSSNDYILTINNGSGSGTYSAGTVVNISPIVPEGKTFKDWTFSYCNGNSVATVADNSITMPSASCSATANFNDSSGTDDIDNDDDVPAINAMTTAITTILGQISGNLSNGIDSIVNSLGAIQGSIVDVINGIASLDTSVNAVKNSVDVLNLTVSSVKESVDGVKTSVDGIKLSVDAVKESVDFMKDDVSSIKTNTDSLPIYLPWISDNIELIYGNTEEMKQDIKTLITNTDPIPLLLPWISQNIESVLNLTQAIKDNIDVIYTKVSDIKIDTGKIADDTLIIKEKTSTISDTVLRMEELMKKISMQLYSEKTDLNINLRNIILPTNEKPVLPVLNDNTQLEIGPNDMKPGFAEGVVEKMNELKANQPSGYSEWVIPLSKINSRMEDISFNFSGSSATPQVNVLFNELRNMMRSFMGAVLWVLGIWQWVRILMSAFTGI